MPAESSARIAPAPRPPTISVRAPSQKIGGVAKVGGDAAVDAIGAVTGDGDDPLLGHRLLLACGSVNGSGTGAPTPAVRVPARRVLAPGQEAGEGLVYRAADAPDDVDAQALGERKELAVEAAAEEEAHALRFEEAQATEMSLVTEVDRRAADLAGTRDLDEQRLPRAAESGRDLAAERGDGDAHAPSSSEKWANLVARRTAHLAGWRSR